MNSACFRDNYETTPKARLYKLYPVENNCHGKGAQRVIRKHKGAFGFLDPISVCMEGEGFPNQQRMLWTPTGCPAVQLNSDPVYLKIASDLTG